MRTLGDVFFVLKIKYVELSSHDSISDRKSA